MIKIPLYLMEGHGHSMAKILKQNGRNVILDISNWIDKKGMSKWKFGIKIKKVFPLHVLFLVGLRWNKDLMCNECSDLVIGRDTKNRIDIMFLCCRKLSSS